MAEEKKFPMTAAGRDKLKAELDDLITKQRPEITNRIQIARSYGDLSENSEYQSAKDEQAFVEGRIVTVRKMIENAEIISADNSDSDEVTLGKEVTFKELPDEDPETYTIVGSVEADPMAGKISNESPMAAALLGKHKGDTVKVPLPNNVEIQVEILSVKTKQD
ncbi:GreA/GreB family (GreA) [Fructobacillus cardui]|uniref:transcription elongation factor GreA n=1 Tax=Fructobacillus cardui TaxID=2893170 RepID=UPI002D81F08F|nr:GreA/GreB family (GreA) [Fructobacillus cardui]